MHGPLMQYPEKAGMETEGRLRVFGAWVRSEAN